MNKLFSLFALLEKILFLNKEHVATADEPEQEELIA